MLNIGADISAPGVSTLPLSRTALVADLRGDPPTPLALEQAIERIEDAVMPARSLAAGVRALAVRDAALHALAGDAPRPLPLQAGVVCELDVEAVEGLFNRVAARAQGRPAGQDAVPVDAVTVAGLLVVREMLHHWGVGRLILLPDPALEN